MSPRLPIQLLVSLLINSIADLTGGEDDAGHLAQEPAASEAGDRGEGRGCETHHDVRHRHVADKQVHASVQLRSPGQLESKVSHWLSKYWHS